MFLGTGSKREAVGSWAVIDACHWWDSQAEATWAARRIGFLGGRQRYTGGGRAVFGTVTSKASRSTGEKSLTTKEGRIISWLAEEKSSAEESEERMATAVVSHGRGKGKSDG